MKQSFIIWERTLLRNEPFALENAELAGHAAGRGEAVGVDEASRGGQAMLYYALVFLLIALVAGLLGFGYLSFAAAGIAKICFVVFLILFLVSLVAHAGRGRTV